MMLNKLAHILDMVSSKVSSLFNIIGVSALFLLMLFMMLDVTRRYIFRAPIEGAFEIVQFFLAFAFTYSIAHTQREKGHIEIELLTSRFKENTQTIIGCIIYFISFAFLCVVTWCAFSQARHVWVSGDKSFGSFGPLGNLPLAPFFYVVAISFAAFTLVMLTDFLILLIKAVKK